MEVYKISKPYIFFTISTIRTQALKYIIAICCIFWEGVELPLDPPPTLIKSYTINYLPSFAAMDIKMESPL